MKRMDMTHISTRVKCAFTALTLTMIMTICAASGDGTHHSHRDIDVVLLGDSNTWLGGDDCSNPKGWPKWFIEKFQPGSCRSFARSGATWTNTAATTRHLKDYTEVLGDNNVIYNQIERLIAAAANGEISQPELIIIGAGTNDAWFTSKRPGVFSKSCEQAFGKMDAPITDRPVNEMLSLAESVRYGCELLMQRFPQAQIVLLTPPQITRCDYASVRRAADIIDECGRRMSLSVIRLDGGAGTYRAIEKAHPVNTYDGAHTSLQGAARTGAYIASQINSVLLF